MKTRTDLTKYENMYDTFDCGHDRTHMEEVRTVAVELAEKYSPKEIELVYVAATLHDIGLSISREDHEKHGFEIVSEDEEIKNAYSEDERELILEAIREHRASTGRPESVVAKIVSDADKVSADTRRTLERAYLWGKENVPELDHEGQLLRSANHLLKKFGENGTGTRVYFKESKDKLEGTYNPIFQALEENDLVALNAILEN